MKKKFLTFVLAFALVVMTGMALMACGGNEETGYYFTISTPEHCNYRVAGYSKDKHGKTFVQKGADFSVYFSLDEGYELDGEITIKINGELKDWTDFIGDASCGYSFTPTADFDVVVEGNIVVKYLDVIFIDSTSGKSIDGVYIKFANQEEQTLADFLESGVEHTNLNVKYGTVVEFWLYTYGYEGNPAGTNLPLATFFNEDGKFGWHYCNEVCWDEKIYFCGKTEVECYICKNENSLTGAIDDNDKIAISFDQETGDFVVTFKDEIPTDILAALQLKINEEVIPYNFTNGENRIHLEKMPYEYGNAVYPYTYRFDLNFYTFDYFN